MRSSAYGHPMEGFSWPAGFARIPNEDWTRAPVETLATKYDTVERHGWYSNLDPTVEDLAATIAPGAILADYSGGTGILMDRLFRRLPDLAFGIVNLDSSPKFLRLALEKLRREERAAFRLLRFLREERRLQLLDESLEAPLRSRGIDGLTSTNAIHLYHNLPETLASWSRVLKPGAHAFVQSGNIARSSLARPAWIIDETVRSIRREAETIVREEVSFARYRAALSDPQRHAQYEALFSRYFPPAHSLGHYLDAMRASGLQIVRVAHRPIRATTREWLEFVSVYHEGILGWVGGAEKVEGRSPTETAMRDRLRILDKAVLRAFGGRESFEAEWTYITARKPG